MSPPAYPRRPASATRRPPPPPPTAAGYLTDWFSKSIISLNSQILSACSYALPSPRFSLFSFRYETDRAVEPVMLSANNASSASEDGRGGYGGGALLRKIGVGILAAAYVGMILGLLLTLAAILGVSLVRLWVEEPVLLRERLDFDYTAAHPTATFSFAHGSSGSGGGFIGHKGIFVPKNKKVGVPLGHTFYVSLVLVMPESDYNRELGIFQVGAELISNGGSARTRSSQPCMLHFTSQPIRLMKELVWGLPLLLGITAESQRIVIPMIRHKESHPRTEAIRVTLMPRSGTVELPQVYGAEIVLKSHLPWMKEILHRWKWTFYVWVTLYIYTTLIIVSLCCFRPLVVPLLRGDAGAHGEEGFVLEASEGREEEERNVLESWKRRRLGRYRRKRGTMVDEPKVVVVEPPETVVVESSASSYTITREDTDPDAPREEADDSESVCFGSGVEE
ncbi:hypothetical protein DM860_009130 [Cuscuta australis]|uniref:Seipin n=1 Tax=Cuscuta australis TaxID=267555 RepID=A0A328DBS8_9ASTE|nr:hypothetical protein DM860_009130 [Cuscuta australis]